MWWPSYWINRALGLLAALTLTLTFGGCSTTQLTVDDGRPVDETLLGSIVAYGHGERAVRPAVARSANLQDPDCDKQWELPFSVASSSGWDDNDRVAWLRGLGVDERPTVIATAADSPVRVGDRIVRVAGLDSQNWEQQLLALADMRDRGMPFSIVLASGRQVTVTPFSICRGFTRFAAPNAPNFQDYHWLAMVHPLEVPLANLSEDEALWLVLWGQGVSEEGGLRMKLVSYTQSVASTLYNLFTIATGVRGAALAAEAAISTARTAASKVAVDLLKQQLVEQGRSLAIKKLREGLADAAEEVTKGQVVSVMQRAAANRGALSGIAYIASTAFEKADLWALNRMEKLGGNPMAAFTLHQKLVQRNLGGNAMVFDVDRLASLGKWAADTGRTESMVAALQGLQPTELVAAIEAMPLATQRGKFSYTAEPSQATGAQPNGFVEALRAMPLATQGGSPKR